MACRWRETLLSCAMAYDCDHAPQMMQVVLEASANANARRAPARERVHVSICWLVLNC